MLMLWWSLAPLITVQQFAYAAYQRPADKLRNPSNHPHHIWPLDVIQTLKIQLTHYIAIQWPHRCVGHVAWAHEGCKGRSQAGSKGQLEVRTQQAPRLLNKIFCHFSPGSIGHQTIRLLWNHLSSFHFSCRAFSSFHYSTAFSSCHFSTPTFSQPIPASLGGKLGEAVEISFVSLFRLFSFSFLLPPSHPLNTF